MFGRLSIALCLISSGFTALAADVSTFYVGKGQLLFQRSTNIPSQYPSLPFLFRAQAFDLSNSASPVSLELPVTHLRIALFDPSYPWPMWHFDDRIASISSLNNNYRSGTYNFWFNQWPRPPTNFDLNFPSDTFPPPLRVSNFSEAQSIDSSNDFTLTWDGPAGARAMDLITFSVESSTGTVFSTSSILGRGNALSGMETSVLIPANTLPRARTLVGLLTYTRVVGTNYSHSDAAGYSGWFSQTDFPIRTLGSGDSEPPVVVSTEPPQGAANIPQDAPLRFIFNKPMRGGSTYMSVGFTNWVSSSFSADKRVFTLTGTNLWKANSAPLVLLNPAHHSFFYFGDLNGNVLLPEPMGIFNIGTGTLGTNIPAPLIDPPATAGTNLTIAVHGQSFRRYGLERGSKLGTAGWTEVQSTYSTNGTARFIEPASASNGFYRATIRP